MFRFSLFFVAAISSSVDASGASGAPLASTLDVKAAAANKNNVMNDGHLRGHKSSVLAMDDTNNNVETDPHVNRETTTRILAHDQGTYVSMSGTNGRAVNAQMQGNTHVLTFRLGPDQSNRIQIRSSPRNQELSIRKIGSNKKSGFTNDDKAFLQDLMMTVHELQTDENDNDDSSIDTVEVQMERLAGLLLDWPQDLDVDY